MKRIFFVEDDLSLISGLSFALKKQGYEIDVARTSMEAKQLWQNGIYDLVILDVSLPDGSGYDLCSKIRETSRVPIMFLTAADEETDIIMAVVGIFDIIVEISAVVIIKAKITIFVLVPAIRIRARSRRLANGVQERPQEIAKDATTNHVAVFMNWDSVVSKGIMLSQ